MSNDDGNGGARGARGAKGDVLLEMRGLKIEGQADDQWHEIVHDIDLDLRRGEVLGLIGESGAGESTIGIAAMGFARPGCRITGGSIVFATCSLQPEEGAARIAALIAKGAPVERVPVDPAEVFGRAEWVSREGDLRTLPCHLAEFGGMDGFYACRLRRLA